MTTISRASRRFVLALGLVGVFGLPASADLNLIPGLTDAQAPAAQAVQLICPMLGAAGGGTGSLPADQQDLFERCREMVHTSNEQQGNGATGFSLGISEGELRGALQNIGTEEISGQGTQGTKTTNGQALGDRLVALRQGGGGFNMAGLNIVIDGYSANIAGLTGPSHGGLNTMAPSNMMMQSSGDDAGAGSERLGMFVTGMFGFGDRDSSDREPGFDFTVPGLVAGIDYRVNSNFVIGGALGYEQYNSDFDVTAVVSGGSLDADLLTASLYGSYFMEKFHVDGVLSYGWNEYDIVRRVSYGSNSALPGTDRTAVAAPDGTQTNLSLTVGYDGNRKNMLYSPYLRVSSSELDIDGYTETGALGLSLAVGDQDISSLRTDLGAAVSWNISGKKGIVVPGFRVEWNHEFDDDVRLITARYAADPFLANFDVQTDDPDTNFATVAGSVNWVLKQGTQMFFDFETQVGRDDLQSSVITVGARFAL